MAKIQVNLYCLLHKDLAPNSPELLLLATTLDFTFSLLRAAHFFVQLYGF